jgi:hypothetical protein
MGSGDAGAAGHANPDAKKAPPSVKFICPTPFYSLFGAFKFGIVIEHRHIA